MFDAHGQLLNASLADYLLPTALDVPRMELDHTVTPSPLNPLGVKGAGEAGAIPVGALFAQAIEDALDLPQRGVELLEIPLSPNRLWELAGDTTALSGKRRSDMTSKPAVSGYLPNDLPGPGRLTLLGLQHVVTMFPATVFVALLCGFHTSTVLLGAGVSTIVALVSFAQHHRHLHSAVLRLELQLHRVLSRDRQGDGRRREVRRAGARPRDRDAAGRHHRHRLPQHHRRLRHQGRRQAGARPRPAADRDRLGRLRHRHRPLEGGARHGVLRRRRRCGIAFFTLVATIGCSYLLQGKGFIGMLPVLLGATAGYVLTLVVAPGQISFANVAAAPLLAAPQITLPDFTGPLVVTAIFSIAIMALATIPAIDRASLPDQPLCRPAGGRAGRRPGASRRVYGWNLVFDGVGDVLHGSSAPPPAPTTARTTR